LNALLEDAVDLFGRDKASIAEFNTADLAIRNEPVNEWHTDSEGHGALTARICKPFGYLRWTVLCGHT
jgi:hypothetical protein